MATKPVTQRGMEQMGCRMVGTQPAALVGIDRQRNGITHGNRTAGDAGVMHVQLAERFRRVVDSGSKAVVTADGSGIASLATRFTIKGRLVGNDINFFACSCTGDLRAITNERDNLALRSQARVADEFGRTIGFDNVEPNRVRCLGAAASPGGTGGALLCGHGEIETGTIDSAALRAQRIFGQIIRKAKSVV